MRKPLIVGNWKENKTLKEAQAWLTNFAAVSRKQPNLPLKVVLCPSFLFLPHLKEELQRHRWPFPFKLGAQDVSCFEEGSHTGEVSAAQLTGLASFVLVGHSERRSCFGEDKKRLGQKLRLCFKHHLIPLFCVSGAEQLEQNLADLEKEQDFAVVYEPPEAISREGKLHPERPEKVAATALELRSLLRGDQPVLYGGSVSAATVKSFLKFPSVDGVLVGAASLDPQRFAKLILTLSDDENG